MREATGSAANAKEKESAERISTEPQSDERSHPLRLAISGAAVYLPHRSQRGRSGAQLRRSRGSEPVRPSRCRIAAQLLWRQPSAAAPIRRIRNSGAVTHRD